LFFVDNNVVLENREESVVHKPKEGTSKKKRCGLRRQGSAGRNNFAKLQKKMKKPPLDLLPIEAL
jgi:hypothetical protein